VVADGISREELQLATRNHGMPLEALRYDVTPIGLHYLLTHFDIPVLDGATWSLEIAGKVARPRRMTLDELRAMPSHTETVTMECAGNGRAMLEPRPASQPWLVEAVGTARWTGVPLADLLATVVVDADAVDVVLTGADRGIDGGVDQQYQRSISVAEATQGDALLAYALDGAPLPPQHGYPVRVVVPGWYGMSNVKWLTAITVTDTSFAGYQQVAAYRVRHDEEDAGISIDRMAPRSLMVPPGIPDFFTRVRTVSPGPCTITGRAWSGHGQITAVEVSDDGGASWLPATVDPPALGSAAWQAWSFAWDARAGEHELACRATDATGTVQPLDPGWNVGGYTNNAVQRVVVTVPGS
jgi:DMSO/TMAO reductase YedYZ molybdopterin-dependent catalytic subunit